MFLGILACAPHFWNFCMKAFIDRGPFCFILALLRNVEQTPAGLAYVDELSAEEYASPNVLRLARLVFDDV